MGIISVAGASGRKYPINIAGDVPDEIERGRIQQYVAAQEQAFAQEYTARFGVNPKLLKMTALQSVVVGNGVWLRLKPV
jgi:hypothetical protein